MGNDLQVLDKGPLDGDPAAGVTHSSLCHFPELILRIRALARRRPAARPRILRAAGIDVDPVRRTAVRPGGELGLSVKEFTVLKALLQASPGFLSTEDLPEQVWDENADPFTNTVTVGRLRRRLGSHR